MSQNHQTQIDTLLVKMMANVPLFRHLDREDIVELLKGASKATFFPNEVVFEEGGEGQCLYVVVSGRFEVYRRSGGTSVPLATVAPGECFGEIGLITHRPRSASVRALEDGVAIRFTQQGVFSRPQAAMQLLRNMADMLVTRLLEADQEIIVLRTGQTPG